jgi:hypothetical protein
MNRCSLRFVIPFGLVTFGCLLFFYTCSDNGGTGLDGTVQTDGTQGCPQSCGPNATCTADNVCSCVPGWKDCNGTLGQSPSDGCECSNECEGTTCSTGTPECTPNLVKACGDAAMYCNVDKCEPCPQGMLNCDGWEDCESDKPCTVPGECEQYGENTCGSQSQFCDDNGQCQPCPQGTYNCGQTGGECECTTGCDGTFCVDECVSATGCNNTGLYCDFGTCTACAAGRFNCNGRDECECDSAGCNGTDCVGQRACDYSDQNVCGGDTTKWCWKNECNDCSTGFNCNGTKGCECDTAGCNGTQCAGQCSGGEC